MDGMLKKILLVEDEDSIRTIAEMSLGMVGGFEVRACASGAAALEAVDAFEPDLMLFDVMMPGMDGPALLAAMRQRQAPAAVPVIFFTARTQREDVEALVALGALEVIAKPFDPMQLADLVKSAWVRAPNP
jgi:DNA-binding response OmpR family regulator